MPVPSTSQVVPFNTDALIIKSKWAEGPGMVPSALGGAFYIQAAASDAYASATAETTILKPASAVSGVILPSGGQVGYSFNGLVMPANFLNVGSILRGRLLGLIGNTGTPNITVRVTLTDSAGNVTALTTTGATAMSTITGSMEFEYTFDAVVRSVGTTGKIISRCGLVYQTATPSAPIKITGVPAEATVDTTESFTIDVKATWSANSSSNTITTQAAYIELTF